MSLVIPVMDVTFGDFNLMGGTAYRGDDASHLGAFFSLTEPEFLATHSMDTVKLSVTHWGISRVRTVS